jgi:hypothetical protein
MREEFHQRSNEPVVYVKFLASVMVIYKISKIVACISAVLTLAAAIAQIVGTGAEGGQAAVVNKVVIGFTFAAAFLGAGVILEYICELQLLTIFHLLNSLDPHASAYYTANRNETRDAISQVKCSLVLLVDVFASIDLLWRRDIITLGLSPQNLGPNRVIYCLDNSVNFVGYFISPNAGH